MKKIHLINTKASNETLYWTTDLIWSNDSSKIKYFNEGDEPKMSEEVMSTYEGRKYFFHWGFEAIYTAT
jgi:hypothetical protein